MFGIELIQGDYSKLFLNPKNIQIPGNNIKVIGYLIAENKKVADDVQKFFQEDHDYEDIDVKESNAYASEGDLRPKHTRQSFNSQNINFEGDSKFNI